MFFKSKSSNDLSHEASLLNGFVDLIREFPVTQVNFLSSFEPFLKKLLVKNAALYFFDDKTKLYVLKKWVGDKPARFSISENYELIKYLKNRKSPLIKSEFADSSHDLRQPALFFFQQTVSSHIFPIFNNNHYSGLLMMDLSNAEGTSEKSAVAFAQLYAHLMAQNAEYQTLNESHQKLSEVAHLKNQLLSNVSHELKTPLNGILGISEAILDGVDGELSPALKEHICMIQESGAHLNKTLSGFLQLVQIEARKSELKHHKTNICELIQEVTSLYEDSFLKKNIQFKMTDLSKPIFVFVEPDQIRTVLMNLLANALKFTPAGEVSLTLKKSVEMLHVSVMDSGIGIDPKKQDLIFEEFYQGDGTHTRVHGGMGLGLAIAKKIINLHGGRIWAVPNGHKGAQFTFTVPLCPGV